MIEIKWMFGIFTTLIIGAYGYTNKVEKASASKDDIKYLRGRVDAIYDHLIPKKESPHD